MSWLARTIANSLRLDDDEEQQQQQQDLDLHTKNDDGSNLKSPPKRSESEPPQSQSPSSSSSPTARGVKEDLSELTKSISRQLWGVASFLAPPPDPSLPQSHVSDSDPNPPQPPDSNVADEDLIAGIRSDFAEISGRFKNEISKLSGNKTVSEFTKFASNFLQIGSEEGQGLEGVVGVTEEVIDFARHIAMHPETWLDFPLPHDADSDGIFIFLALVSFPYQENGVFNSASFT